jgi:hypothetical protein
MLTPTGISRCIRSRLEPSRAWSRSEAKSPPTWRSGLALLFGTSAEFWLNGQLTWGLYHAMRGPDAADLDRIASSQIVASDP